MVAKVLSGPSTTVTAARAVVSGDLHLFTDTRCGLYQGLANAASGDVIVLDPCIGLVLDIAAGSAVAVAVGGACNFNFTTQEAVATGGTNIGVYAVAKTNGQTRAKVILNLIGKPYA